MSDPPLCERDVCTKLITPALERAGWNIDFCEGWSRRCPPQPGDLLFTREAPMGEVGLVEEAALRRREDRAVKLAEAVVQEMVA
jgi:hypothetical protein